VKQAPAYRFSLGPWNIGTGGDPFGPPVRPQVPCDAVPERLVLEHLLGG
jgi:hypothetical protein